MNEIETLINEYEKLMTLILDLDSRLFSDKNVIDKINHMNDDIEDLKKNINILRALVEQYKNGKNNHKEAKDILLYIIDNNSREGKVQ